jgi:hypothetical protein
MSGLGGAPAALPGVDAGGVRGAQIEYLVGAAGSRATIWATRAGVAVGPFAWVPADLS